MTSSNKVVICRTCNGRGWYEDHAPHCDGDECIECGCPVQVQCPVCQGTGMEKVND